MTLFVVAKVDASLRLRSVSMTKCGHECCTAFSVANCVVGRNEKTKGISSANALLSLTNIQPKMLR